MCVSCVCLCWQYFEPAELEKLDASYVPPSTSGVVGGGDDGDNDAADTIESTAETAAAPTVADPE